MVLAAGVFTQSAIGHAVMGNDRTLQETKTLTLNAEKISTLAIDAGAGGMEIKAADIDRIEVVAKIYQEKAHDNYCLSLTRENNQARLESAVCRDNRFGQSRHQYSPDNTPSPGAGPEHFATARVILRLTVQLQPKLTMVQVISIFRNIAGPVDIHDGSGLITAKKHSK